MLYLVCSFKIFLKVREGVDLSVLCKCILIEMKLLINFLVNLERDLLLFD